ncbi:MAG TPA: hypothetical protein VL001_00150 [Candidimonas sp.]|nr:hypothetical protein [Candidimonas sp.]
MKLHPLSRKPIRRRPINRMNGARHLSILTSTAMLLAVALQMPVVARADDLATEQMSVRELMRLDTARALDDARTAPRKDNALATAANQSGRYAQSGSLKLVAIYGVGKKLLAEVVVGQQNQMYMRGRALPIGVKEGDASASYMLRGISDSCVQLERQLESHILCLHPALGTTK